jgi:chromosome segregation ATPase
MKSMLEDILGFEPGELDNLDSPEEILRRAHVQIEENQARHQSERQELEARRSKSKKKSARQLEKEAQAEADAKKINQSIRDVYRKLASALHPDRETDPQERERKTLLMQRINQAYEKQNLLLLLELQLELEHIDQIAIARIDEDRLRHYNTILKGQIAELKHELMRVESSFCGQFGMAPFARVKPETVLRDLSYEILQAQQANNELERELHTLKDAKSVKAWLKKIRRGVANNSFDDCPF